MKRDFEIENPLERAAKIRENSSKRAGVVAREAKVVSFLREHPLSTADEVFIGTGYGVGVANRFVSWKKYHGTICYRLNHEQLRREGLE